MSKVTDTHYMFYKATSFSQNICSWNSDIQDADKYGMFLDSGCPTASIDEGTPSDTSVCHSGCIPPPNALPHLVDNGWSPSGSLGICEGDCDGDQDCDGSLICFQRSGHTHVPGCANGGSGDVGGYGYCVPCFDNNADCEYWASIGECGINPAYMLVNCKKSCSVCV